MKVLGDRMSTKDLSILSYKELQALAIKHRVPGNIKKLLLVKILHAIKSGNSSEVSRLLTDLKKNRKKRTKRLKIMKSDDNELMPMTLQNNSSNLINQQDHYLFPLHQQDQQQYPFQWVGAEEELGTSKYDDIKCTLSYNDIRQFVFYNAQGTNGSCDTNNNSTLLDEIMDLRTEATVSNNRTNIETSHISNFTQHQLAPQNSIETSASKKMSLLLKKMLQAPVGANLGEIASPISHWPLDSSYNLREGSPDNSETISAKSDINETDEIWQDSITATPGLPSVFENEQNYNDNPYYRRANNATPYYRSSFDNGIEQNSLNFEQPGCSQYQFNLAPQTDAQENCRSWLASNTLDIAPAATMQYQSLESAELVNPSTESSPNTNQGGQYCLNSDLYTTQSSGILSPSENISDLQFYPSSPYVMKAQETQDYYRQICAAENATPGLTQDFYETQNSSEPNHQSRYTEYTPQLVTPIYHVELENVGCDPGYYQEQSTTANRPNDPLQQVQDQQYEGYVPPTTSPARNNPPPMYGASILDSYWPRWSLGDRDTSKTGGRSLENTLNLCTPNYIDYTKLNETCCVYSNKAPVMTLRKGLNSVPSIQETRNSTEFRQHNFASNWLLYSDQTAVSRGNFAPTPSSTFNGLSLNTL